MIKIFLSSLLIFFTPISFSSELMLTVGGSFNYSNILGQSDVPAYRGNGFFGEVEFLMPFSSENALSIFGIYHSSSQENTANSEIKERLEIGFLGGGVKLYFSNFFLSAGLGRVRFVDDVSGLVDKKITASEVGQEIGTGYRLKISTLTGLVLSVHALRSSLDPSNGTGFFESYNLWQYRASIGINIIIPSSGPAE